MRNLVKMTLADQIYTILREDIINQTIQCGEKLTLKALQERFDISSTPIREAMNRLSQEGLIDHVTNVGAKVVDLKEKDIQEIYDFCKVLDTTALKLALDSGRIDEIIPELEQCIKLQEKALAAEHLEIFKQESDNFHDILFRYADNERLYNAALNIRSQLSILTTKYQNFTVTRSVVFSEHRGIFAAISDRDFDKAMELMSMHFEHARDYLLEKLKSSEEN